MTPRHVEDLYNDNKWVIEDMIIYNMVGRINVTSLTCLTFSLLFEVNMSFLWSKSGNLQFICLKYLKGALSFKSFKHKTPEIQVP